MRLSVTTCVTYSVTHRSLHEIAERHLAVLAALRARDPVRAAAEIRRHIEEPESGSAPQPTWLGPRLATSQAAVEVPLVPRANAT